MKLISFSFILIALDQITKHLAQKFLSADLGTGIFFMDKIGFEYIKNFGVAFGIPIPFFVIVLLNVLLLFSIYFFYKNEFNMKEFWNKIALILIISGGIGNLIDRLIYGYVIDFIALWSYPRFNLADVYITVGVLLTLLNYAKINRLKTKN